MFGKLCLFLPLPHFDLCKNYHFKCITKFLSSTKNIDLLYFTKQALAKCM